MSISINLDTIGSEEVAKSLRRLDESIKDRIQEQLAMWAQDVKTEAEHLVPVRTGYLQSTIFAKCYEWTVEVGAQASYAVAVEFGTYRMHARPYLTPAIQSQLSNLEAALSKAIESSVMEVQV